MSGKAKTAQKGDAKGRGPNDPGFKHEKPRISKVLEFRKTVRGTLVPKTRFVKEDA